ncbi:MAG: hypothetical protein K2X82_24105, partial [Gemmataceae bacterium]|nr:hypothetical protein [Gemmataceae bacterium]
AALDAALDRLAALPPGWDGHAAPAVDPNTLAAVRAWALTMPGRALAAAPAAVPLSSGAVQLEWHAGGRVLELEWERPDLIHYLKWDPAAGVEEEGAFPAADHRRADDLIGWARGRP